MKVELEIRTFVKKTFMKLMVVNAKHITARKGTNNYKLLKFHKNRIPGHSVRKPDTIRLKAGRLEGMQLFFAFLQLTLGSDF